MGDFDAACWHGCKWLEIYDDSQPCAECNESNDYPYYEQEIEPMNEEKLKTLNDFKFYTGGWEEDGTVSRCYFINGKELKEELKEEAKKWISKIEAKIKEKEGQFDDLGIDLGMEYAEAGEAIIGFIKHFFNLEGEK